MLRIILLLRGFYIKLGQMGATRADFLPKQYLNHLQTLLV
jgi:predicted unusual protein kinase regulating ubiquinone biosynthesis (AarF/ABC1/UbiB family)